MKILVPIGCRSDEGLSAPVIKRLQKEDWCEVITCNLIPQDFPLSYNMALSFINTWHPDLIFITGDRVEMCAAAAAAFHNNVKIAHLYAGVVNDPITTYDDIDRHCITLWSDIQFCENEEARCQVEAHLYPLKSSNCHMVGITHLDDLEIDESKVPCDPTKLDETYDAMPKPYDLILYNTPTKGDNDDIQTILDLLNSSDYSVLVSGNPDGDMDTLFADKVDEFHVDLPRPQFLGLLKNCQRFITNSSAAIYEAPVFLDPDQIVMVGDRNRNRPKTQFQIGASIQIVNILKEYLCGKNP